MVQNSITDRQVDQWRKKLVKLHNERKQLKSAHGKRKQLTQGQRMEILHKTGGKCHVCGVSLKQNTFQADHVVAHIHQGGHLVENYLPACATCNNYRWHYLPEELQIILKVGIWARAEMEKGTTLGASMSQKYLKKELNRTRRGG